LAEVLAGDGFSIEVLLDHFLDLGEAIEPFEQFGAGLVVFQAPVQLFADMVGQAGNLAIAGSHNFQGVEVWFDFSFSAWPY
jgi:hypothetical protein